jgi:hypothetical protein
MSFRGRRNGGRTLDLKTLLAMERPYDPVYDAIDSPSIWDPDSFELSEHLRRRPRRGTVRTDRHRGKAPNETRPLTIPQGIVDRLEDGGDPFNPLELHLSSESDASPRASLHFVPFVSRHLLPRYAKAWVDNIYGFCQPSPCSLSDLSYGHVPMTQIVWRFYFRHALIDRFHLLPAEIWNIAYTIADYVMVLLWEPAYERWQTRAEELYHEWKRSSSS